MSRPYDKVKKVFLVLILILMDIALWALSLQSEIDVMLS